VTAQEQDSSLAAMISALADGQPLTRAARDRILLGLVDEAQANGASWAVIAAAFRYPSGKQAKKIIHAIRERVKREQAQGREHRGGPYVHEHAAPRPGERYVPYTMTGPGVVDTED